MAISITLHDIDHTEVCTFKDFVTVKFTTSTQDTVALFFPDHAAVQHMIAELMASAKDGLTEWRESGAEPVNRIAYSVDEDSIQYQWDDIMEDRTLNGEFTLKWNDLENEIQDTMIARIGNAITNSSTTTAVVEAIYQVASSYMEASII